MKNKKGFTLIELLATIVIIALIMAIVMPSATRISQNNKQRMYKEYENMMIEYAKASEYANDDVIDLFYLNELDKIKEECEGYVEVDHTVDPPTYTPHLACGDQYTSPTYNPTVIPSSSSICPGCKFMYQYIGTFYTTWNSDDEDAEPVPTELLYDDYRSLIKSTGHKYFLGVVLNENNQITRAYACGIKGATPFCLEGTSDGSKYNTNKNLLQSTKLWNNVCGSYTYNSYYQPGSTYEVTYCDRPYVDIESTGYTTVGEEGYGYAFVNYTGLCGFYEHSIDK